MAKITPRKIWTVVHVLIFLSVVVLSVEIADLSPRGLLLVAMVCLLYLPIIVRMNLGTLDIFEPIVFANFALGIMFVARPLSDLATKEMIHMGIPVTSRFDYALTVALAGVFAFQMGYHSRLTLAGFKDYSRWLPQPPPQFRPLRAGLSGIILAVVGVGLFAIFVQQQGGLAALAVLVEGRGASDDAYFASSTGYFYLGLLMLVPASAMLFAAALTTKKAGWYVGFAICLGIFSAYFLARGDRSHLLPMLSIPVFWHLFRGSRPRGRNLLLYCALAISMIAIIREVRNVDSYFAPSDMTDAVLQPWNEALDTLQGADAEMFDTLANELLIVPSAVHFQHGAVVTDLLVRAVPRAFWPEKSTESMDLIGQTLWPAHYAVARAGAASSIIGNLYADSGFVTVVLGMLLIGAALRWFWLWYSKYGDSVGAQLLYASTMPFTVILLRGTFPDTFSRMLFVVAPLLIALRVAGPTAHRIPANSEQR